MLHFVRYFSIQIGRQTYNPIKNYCNYNTQLIPTSFDLNGF